jgi:RNA polymerase sigma factor (sigma-70 family)
MSSPLNTDHAGNKPFNWLYLEFLAGIIPIDELLAHAEFLSRGQRICRWVARRSRYNSLELFQDACVKVLDNWAWMLVPEKTPDAESFFKLFNTIALNLFRDYLRRLRKEGALFSDVPAEDLSPTGPKVDLNEKLLLDEFARFAETLPEGHRLALTLRLKNYPEKGSSFEEIAKALNAAGIECTPPTVRKWVRDSASAFINDGNVSSLKKAARR